jgi:acetolactate synthase-1/3 small subunit
LKHTISLLVENKPGVLARIAGLFSGKGYNIDSITEGKTETQGISRMTIITHGDDRVVDQITKQLNRLIDVLKVNDLTEVDFVNRELALIKVAAEGSTRSDVIQVANIFQAKIIDLSTKTLTLEVTGPDKKIEAVIAMLKPFGIREVARTGTVAMVREFQSGNHTKISVE